MNDNEKSTKISLKTYLHSKRKNVLFQVFKPKIIKNYPVSWVSPEVRHQSVSDESGSYDQMYRLSIVCAFIQRPWQLLVIPEGM